MKNIFPLSIALGWLLTSPDSHAAALTLDQSLALAERLHPDISEAQALLRAAQGRVAQAAKLSNPDFIARIESAPLKGRTADDAEYLAGVSQSVPLGPRLSKARAAEKLAAEARLHELEVRRREVHKRVHSSFATALYQDKAFITLSNITQTFEQAVAITKARVDAGDALPEDLARIELELLRSNIESKRALSMRRVALMQLATAIGDPQLAVERLDGTLDNAFEVPTLESVLADLAQHPAVLRAAADSKASSARVQLAKAQRIPDITVEALYRRLQSDRRDAFDLGVSIPLPLFDRNTAKIREAHGELTAAEARHRSTQNELWLRTQDSHSRLSAALAKNRTLRDELLPRAETILKTTDARYRAGDLRVADLLLVRRDWASIQLTYLESLRDLAEAWSDLRSITMNPE
jgi:cobalt-zinc-cadmium efflux system outer membrane protein